MVSNFTLIWLFSTSNLCSSVLKLFLVCDYYALAIIPIYDVIFFQDDGEVEYEHKQTPSTATFKSFSENKKDVGVMMYC